MNKTKEDQHAQRAKSIDAALAYLAQKGALHKLAFPIKVLGSDTLLTSKITHAIGLRSDKKERKPSPIARTMHMLRGDAEYSLCSE
jgi:hypothetical protein